MRMDARCRIVFCFLLLTCIANSEKCTQKKINNELFVNCSFRSLNSVPSDLSVNTTTLDLSHNNLTSLFGLENLVKLVKLDLTSNKLRKWNSSWLNNCSKLSELHLTQNKLKQPPDLCEFIPQLSKLWLNANPIEDAFDSSYAKCSNLRTLVLAETGYSELNSSTFAGLTDCPIQSLQINGHKLKRVLPDSLVWLETSLESLDLGQVKAFDGMMLKQLMKAANFSKLHHLKLKGTSVTIEDSTFSNCSASATIQSLLLDSTPITELSARSLLPLRQLNQLSLRQTRVSGWAAEVFEFLNELKILDLRSTSVTSIGGINGSFNPLPQLNAGLTELKLAGANISCDCNLLWLHEQLLKPNIKKKMSDAGETVCAQPQALNGTKILEFQPEGCENPSPNPDYRMPQLTFIAIVCGSIAIAAIAVAVAIVVVSRCRRVEGPRLVLDDDCDPLMVPGERRSIWIRLRRLLRPRSSRQSRPPIFVDPAPEDFLSEDA